MRRGAFDALVGRSRALPQGVVGWRLCFASTAAICHKAKKKPWLGGQGINGIAANNKGETMMKQAYISNM